MTKTLYLSLLLGSLAFASCSGDSKETTDADTTADVISEAEADAAAAAEMTDGESAHAALDKMDKELND
ncbi:MAG: hypothetical protein ACPG31_04890 [Planctomycetota bacterium]